MEFHYYDFQREPELLVKLKQFVDSVKTKNMQKWVASIHRALQKVSLCLCLCVCVCVWGYWGEEIIKNGLW